MPELTSSAMHDAQDAEDSRLMEAGEFRLLVENYYGVMIERCAMRLRSRERGVEAAGDVAVRLLSELKRGKSYGGVPFRVVVHQVIRWVCAEHRSDPPRDVDVDGHDPGQVDRLEFEERDRFEWLLAELTDREREVVTLRWWDGLAIEEVAARLRIERNAVDQRLHRAHRKIRKRLEAT